MIKLQPQLLFTLFKSANTKAANTKSLLWYMIRRWNNSSCQFHQHYTHTFFVQIFRQSQKVTRKSCQNDVCTKISFVKRWWNWHLVNNIDSIFPGPISKKIIAFYRTARCCQKWIWMNKRENIIKSCKSYENVLNLKSQW